jgi:hypothetical protein
MRCDPRTDRGAMRIVIGAGGERFFTPNHDISFIQF